MCWTYRQTHPRKANASKTRVALESSAMSPLGSICHFFIHRLTNTHFAFRFSSRYIDWKKKVTDRVTARQVTDRVTARQMTDRVTARQVTDTVRGPDITQATENYEYFTQGTTKASGQITESRVIVGQVRHHFQIQIRFSSRFLSLLYSRAHSSFTRECMITSLE